MRKYFICRNAIHYGHLGMRVIWLLLFIGKFIDSLLEEKIPVCPRNSHGAFGENGRIQCSKQYAKHVATKFLKKLAKIFSSVESPSLFGNEI